MPFPFKINKCKPKIIYPHSSIRFYPLTLKHHDFKARIIKQPNFFYQSIQNKCLQVLVFYPLHLILTLSWQPNSHHFFFITMCIIMHLGVKPDPINNIPIVFDNFLSRAMRYPSQIVRNFNTVFNVIRNLHKRNIKSDITTLLTNYLQHK